MEASSLDMHKLFKEFISKLDQTEKKTGDYVHLIHECVLMYLHDFDTKKQLIKNYDTDLIDKHQDLVNNLAIVADTNVKFTYNCGHCDEEHKSDLVIYYPHNKKKYYCKSIELKIIE